MFGYPLYFRMKGVDEKVHLMQHGREEEKLFLKLCILVSYQSKPFYLMVWTWPMYTKNVVPKY